MKDKNTSTGTRKFVVHDKRTPGLETVIIEHDLDVLIREVTGKDEPKRDKTADVIPLKRDGH